MPKPGEVYRIVDGKNWVGSWTDSLIVIIKHRGVLEEDGIDTWTIRPIFPVYGWPYEWTDISVSVGLKNAILVGFLEHIPDEWYPPLDW